MEFARTHVNTPDMLDNLDIDLVHDPTTTSNDSGNEYVEDKYGNQ